MENMHAPRPSTPKGSRPGSGLNTPQRPGTPSRVVRNMADAFIKDPPNNLGLADPSEQSRTNDLIGVEGTEVARDPPTAEEMQKIEELAKRLNK